MDVMTGHRDSAMERAAIEGETETPARRYSRQVGGRFRKARQAAGRSLPEVARMLGVSYQQVEKYENGSNTISAFYLTKTAEYLNVPLLWLLQGDEDVGSNAEVPFRLSAKEHQLLATFRGFKAPTNRTLVRRIVGLIAAADNAGSAFDATLAD